LIVCWADTQRQKGETMVTEILAFWTPGPLEIIIILAVFGLFVVIPAVLIVLLVVFLLQSNKERRRLRLKVEELTDEPQQVRKQVKADEEDKSSAKSG